jgi:hypothetical protein
VTTYNSWSIYSAKDTKYRTWYYASRPGSDRTLKSSSLDGIKRQIDHQSSKGNPMRRRRGLNRFKHRNPLTGRQDLMLAGAGAAVLGLVGYAIYSRSQAQATQMQVSAGPTINAPNQSAAAYAAWQAGFSAGLNASAQHPSGGGANTDLSTP